MQDHLFLFTLGPVQSFIAQARKTHDLYAGSRILAELTRAAADEAIRLQIDLIFPAKITKGSPIPNRFIGKISGKPQADLQQIGIQIEKAVQDRFTTLADAALKAAGTPAPKDFQQQIAGHCDINWLFYPVESDTDEAYRKAYYLIEQEMQAVKNFRLKPQMPEQGRKCSLDGERNALFFGPGTNPRYIGKDATVIQGGMWLAENEGLSAVSLVKRGFEKPSTPSFPSTAEIALLDTVKEKSTLFDFYKDFIKAEEFDYQFCYKENLTQKYLEKNGYRDILTRISPAALEGCRQQLFGARDLPKHYALVAFDGDNMGQIMSGAADFFKGSDLEAFQRSVSERLLAFAENVHQLFTNNPTWGRVVYTGGDDFMGFINLQHLFPAMAQLRENFQRTVNQPLRSDGYFKEGINFTFSAGIALAHYKIPLSIVIQTAKEAEECAKKSGRNAFSIAALKHSGESHTATYPWELNNDMQYWNALEKLTGFLEQQVCSENFARVLAKSFYLLSDESGNVINSEMLETEVKRTVKRAMSPDKKDETSHVTECILSLLRAPQSAPTRAIALKDFTEMLNIALYLKRVRKNTQKNK